MSDVTVVWSAGTGACWTWCPFGRRPNQWSAVDGSVSRHQWGRDKAGTEVSLDIKSRNTYTDDRYAINEGSIINCLKELESRCHFGLH